MRRKLSAELLFRSVKNIVKVKVGVATKVGWKNGLEERVLTMMDGEEKEILGGAPDGYPHTVWSSYREIT